MQTARQSPMRPTVAEVSARALQHNWRAVCAAAGPAVEVLAVIKADAYGHGAALCAPVLAAAGAQWLGVTSVDEGVLVREALSAAGQGARVLVMCGVSPGDVDACLRHDLTPVVWDTPLIDTIAAEARRLGVPTRSMGLHVELDTGMARQGVVCGPLLQQVLLRFQGESPLRLDGVMTHLASTECARDPQNARQMALFAQGLQQVHEAGLQPSWVHAGNTSSTDGGWMSEDILALAGAAGGRAMTRAGLSLYGHALALEGVTPRVAPEMEPVLTWKTRVTSLREVEPGSTVGYNATFVAQHRMQLALLPVGYADGFRRALSSTATGAGGAVLLRGVRAPVVGRVSMDLTVVDVTAVPGVEPGDEAVLLGRQGDGCIRAEEHAQLAGTSVYEILCGISARVPRVLTA